ncbi:hypothetical protein [Pelomonas sp. Root1444]|uniref:hypothetical protein n=1 Tax=Pelomonas sp. Root1444 TaxID=1736464 RepID=UPI0007038DF9|nr:hypothetical protein [Pelomonas sp. Root1444]KQY80907.1 hypothetical protein ASD35_03410 [Pelomonas sp. Root1444]
MASGVYKFFADENSINRFMSKNMPSTDALSALARWTNAAAGRSFDKLEDTDDHIVARLSWSDEDDSAGGSLQGLLLSLGLEHEYLPSGHPTKGA